MLHVAEEDVPDDGDGVDVGDAVLGRHVHEVDVLRRRPDAPVKLQLTQYKVTGYSDTLGMREECHSKQAVTLNGVTVSKHVCNLNKHEFCLGRHVA